jgi:hypothetical protein
VRDDKTEPGAMGNIFQNLKDRLTPRKEEDRNRLGVPYQRGPASTSQVSLVTDKQSTTKASSVARSNADTGTTETQSAETASTTQ